MYGILNGQMTTRIYLLSWKKLVCIFCEVLNQRSLLLVQPICAVSTTFRFIFDNLVFLVLNLKFARGDPYLLFPRLNKASSINQLFFYVVFICFWNCCIVNCCIVSCCFTRTVSKYCFYLMPN
jgi:hypothetical protein